MSRMEARQSEVAEMYWDMESFAETDPDYLDNTQKDPSPQPARLEHTNDQPLNSTIFLLHFLAIHPLAQYFIIFPIN
jgi:hypothetical protein